MANTIEKAMVGEQLSISFSCTRTPNVFALGRFSMDVGCNYSVCHVNLVTMILKKPPVPTNGSPNGPGHARSRFWVCRLFDVQFGMSFEQLHSGVRTLLENSILARRFFFSQMVRYMSFMSCGRLTPNQRLTVQRSAKFLFPGCMYCYLALPG